MSEFSNEAMQSYPFADITLPLSWSLVALEEISEDVSPGFASGKHNSDGTGVPHLRPMNVDRDGQIDLKVIKSVAMSNGIELRQGDVLFNNTNSAELVGKTAVVSAREGGFAFSNHMTRIRPEEGVNSVFVARQLHFLWMAGYMKHRCTNHVNQASISSKTLAKTIPFHLPPAAEQTRIVAKLEELLTDLDAGVAELKGAQKKLAQYRQSLLKAAMDGALTAEWRANNTPAESGAQLLERILQERRARWEAKQLAKFTEQGKTPPKDWQKKYPEPVQPDTTELPELPEGWVWATIDQLAAIGTGVTPLKSKSQYYAGGDIPWVTSGALNNEMVTEAIEYVTPLALKECRLELYPAGALLVAMYGEGKTRGKCSELAIPATINQAIAALVLEDAAIVCKPYIKSFLFKSYDDMRKQASGGVQPNLNLQIVRSIAIPIPPLDEQHAITDTLSAQLDAAKDQGIAIELSLKQSTAQRQNILRAAFAGQLVSQDPNDEPASLLLERIRAERSERAKQPKPRKTKQGKEIATVVSRLIDVLAEAGGWVPAQEAFRRCGVADGALTERIEELYAELRKLDKAGRLAVEAVTDAQGRKLYDKLKLLAA
ncbi:TPA: restriction endonuclease subunit S [Pseudomonas aeruginosa]|uniref:restriction endonuclease subunit S n=1 Tax=Pseudomonas aeruginosa TaxID=287 RepID=UPI000F533795|nr:restriction endonuclease subunit S [Pseudomonas aeruginosa]MBH9233669.1 restriction endonuclease subunit S [Pseudomonas aeruginosa]MBI7529045.1 restriction endonuclease subunit S [Pseudomonas aeruginosa]MCS8234496.1 restriction endonuclease subunit S [Pseudomonas aeruginosa]RQF91944.1 restriction endonuclease subunit S [Pseudomonas aeruginosa]HBO1632134.1 restriction endonuclease subunit S [Pseudomonas aeruginosa]